MAQTTMSIRVSDTDKKMFEDFCSNTGMNPSVAVNIYIKTVIREQRIPFEISSDPFYSDRNIAAVKKSIDQIRAGNTVTMSLEDLER